MTAQISFYFGNKTIVDFPLGTQITGRGVSLVNSENNVSTYALTRSALANVRKVGWLVRAV